MEKPVLGLHCIANGEGPVICVSSDETFSFVHKYVLVATLFCVLSFITWLKPVLSMPRACQRQPMSRYMGDI